MDGPVRISIGTEPMQYIGSEVLKASILRRTNLPVEFTESWSPGTRWHPLLKEAPKLSSGTRFSAWRWLVPELYKNKGHAIYLDADQVVLTDIAGLWKELPIGKCLAAVTNATGVFGKKIPERDHVQTSVVLFDNAACDWDCRELFSRPMPYRDLMQLTWMRRKWVQELDPAWNRFGVTEKGEKNYLLHWSHVRSQPYRNPKHPTADIFREELTAAVAEGFVTWPQVVGAVESGYLDRSYLDVST